VRQAEAEEMRHSLNATDVWAENGPS
jgi:hypothetical protein